ncbi:hypothetical protein ACFV0C_38285 [Streptomyces sp. NPDC059568]
MSQARFHGGRVCEKQTTVDGTTLYMPLPVEDFQLRREEKARFYHLVRIPCRYGDHTVRIRVDQTAED